MTVVVAGVRQMIIHAVAAGLQRRGVTAEGASMDAPLDEATAVVVDLGHGPDTSGLGGLIARAPRIPILVISDVTGVAATVSGVQTVPLTVDLDALCNVVRHALDDELVPAAVPQTQADVPEQSRTDVAARLRTVQLTPREQDVLRTLLVAGSNAAIGARLGISSNTVRTHMARLLAKLEVSSRYEAATLARRAGLQFPTDPTHGERRATWGPLQ